MKNILVAIEADKEVGPLNAQAVKLAKLSDAKIWIIHVTESDPDDFLAREAGPQYKYDQRAKERKQEAESLHQWADDLVKDHGVAAEGILIEGPVIKSIKKIVEERNIDLVIAGHKKKSFLYGLFTANKKKDLVDELEIPLLSVPLSK